MHSPYGTELGENHSAGDLCAEGFFCRWPEKEREAFRQIKVIISRPAGETLFVEGQPCRGIYIVCEGRVKLSATSRNGDTIIFKIAKPGDVLGLNTSILATEHNMTAETGQPCQLSFVKQVDFLEFLRRYGNARLQVATHLSLECQQAYQQIRSLTKHSATQRIARLMVDWSHGNPLAFPAGKIRMMMALTQEEIGQVIGMSRETVTRTLGSLRRQQIAEIHDSTLLIHDLAALQRLAS